MAIAGIPLSAIALLLLTASVSILWSHYKLLRGDELYEMWTDSVSSVGQLVNIQLTCPIALDPFAYHAIAHVAIGVLGANTFAIRLPSLIGVLLMQICLFIFVRRIATERAAIFALGFPALTCVMGYSMEGRPYGLMLGFFGLAMVSWQSATLRETGRSFALVTLTLAIALCINTHYFGILLLAPICVAELVRTIQRRRLDIPLVASIGAGAAGIAAALPFMKAAKEFRGHYGLWDRLQIKDIGWDYLWTLANHNSIKGAKIIDRGLFALVVILVGLSVWAFFLQMRRKTLPSIEPQGVFVLTLAGLPFFGYLLAFFASSTLEARFVVGLVVGVAALTALGLFPLWRSERAEKLIIVTLFVAIGSTGIAHSYMERMAALRIRSSMALPPQVKAALMASPSKLLYIQDMENFGVAKFYEPDAEVRSRIVLVYSGDQEKKWNHESVIALTADHLRSITHFTTIPYESLTAQTGDHIFVEYGGAEKPLGWNWIGREFLASHADVNQLGPAFCGNGEVMGNVESVRFVP